MKRLALFIFILFLSAATYAAQPELVNIEFAIAKACHFYDTGRLNDALKEFKAILAQDPGNKAADEYINKISARRAENGISVSELNEQLAGYRNAINARKKIEITDHQKPVVGYGREPYERFINQTSLGQNDRRFDSSTDKSFEPNGFFIAEHIRMDNILRSPVTALKKKMPRPRRGLSWNEFIFDATGSYDPDKQKLSFRWNFGDGETSDEPVTKHTYLNEGDYTVTLTVKDDSGLTCDTATAQQIVKAYKAVPEPAPGPDVFMKPVGEAYQSTFSLDALYHDNSYDSARIRRIMYSLSNPGGMRFIAGDTSTQLSRYTLRGMYYRGVNYSLKNDVNEFKILWGAVPHYTAKKQDSGNKDLNTYIYPRKVFGARDSLKVLEGYKIGVSYMELKDSERVRVIDANYNPKHNRVLAIDQSIEAVPEIWNIETEDAYSTSDEDRTNKDILISDDKLRDFAHYIRSEIALPKFRLINSYERIGSDFRSYADLASTNVTWLAGLTSDREKIDNYLEYRPFEFDPIYLDLNLSRIRSNLDKDNNIEMINQLNYGGAVRFVPDYETWLPQAAVRLKFMDTLSVPGSQYASNDTDDRDIIFELAKQLYGIDLNTSYARRKTVDNIETFGSYSNIYNIRAAKQLTDMILLSGEYGRSNTTKDQNGDDGTIARTNYINLNTALRLWAGANLSLGYSRQDDSDATGILQDTDANIYSTTFSWPFSRYSLKSGAEFSIAPYFTYQLEQGKTAESKNRYIWTAACDATYQIAKDHRLSASFLYRQDENDYYSPSTGSSSAGVEDRRFLLTYQKIFQ